MSHQNIADEASRARKILAKHKAWSFSSTQTRAMELQTGSSTKIGEFAVVCLIGTYGANQYTICRPIGLTDLAADDWVMIPTDQIPATLARAEDPQKAKIDKLRAARRTEALVNANLLLAKEKKGVITTYYPDDEVVPRNTHLEVARGRLQEVVKPLRAELAKLSRLPPKKKKGTGPARSDLNAQIQAAGRFMEYLDEHARQGELKIREYLSKPEVEAMVQSSHPYLHRTLVGPFGDQPQVAIVGARGYPLIDVLAAINRQLTNGLDLSATLGDTPSVADHSSGARGRSSSRKPRRKGFRSKSGH